MTTFVKYYPVDLVGARFGQSDTSPMFQVGETAKDNLGGLWKYILAAAAIAQFDLVDVTDTNTTATNSATTTTIATPTGKPSDLGIAQVAIASGSYGWVWRGVAGGGTGNGIKVNVSAAGVTADTKLYTTATAGAVSSTLVASSLVQGLRPCATVAGAGTVEVAATGLLTANCQD